MDRRLQDSRPRRTRTTRVARAPPGACRSGSADPVSTRRYVEVMARNTSFYYSFLVLPREQRRAIEAVWDFCRAVDDAVDEPAPVLPSGEAVGFWLQELARCYEGAAPQTCQGRGLQPVITQLDLPRQAFADVIDGL